MSDNDLPDIPSFEELGLSPEEVAELEKELQNEGSGDEGDASPADVSASGKGAASGSDGPAPAPKADAASAAAKGMKSGKAKKAAKPPKAKRTRKPGTAEEPGEARESPPRPSLPAPMGGLRGPISFVFLVALAWASGANRALPSPVAESAPDSVFSSARAMQHVEAIASTAHPPGSPAHDRARAYLVTELRRLGLEPSVQTTTSIVGRGTFVRAATVRNVLARMPGTASGPAVLVTAHYDGRGIAKGAGDDASGVATILETMRALRTGAPLTNDLIVLLTDGEELGLLGARAFVDEHPWMDDVGLVISIEMRGGGGPSIMFETGANSGWVVQQYKQADPYPVATSLAFEIYRRMPNDTDFTPFKEAGKQGLNFAGIGRAPVYHQVYDSPENLSPATLQHHGSHALAALRHFGMADLSAVDGPDPVYFSVPVLGLVVYPAWWVWVLAVVCVVLWLVSVAVVRARGGRWAGLFAGLLGGAGTIAGAAAAGHFLFSLRSSAHPEFGALQGSAFHSEGWYVLSLVFAGFLLGALVFGALRRWFTLGELSVGSLFIPLAGMVAATALIPLGAMILQWPFLGAVIGALAVGWFTKEGRVGSITWLILLASAVPATVMLAPVLELLWLSMSLRLGLGLGVLVALSAILVLPLLDVMRAEPNRWWFALAAVLLVAGSLAMGVRNTAPSAERPAPSTLVYLVDRDMGSASWGTDPSRGDDAPGVAWATAQVGAFGEPAAWGAEPLAREFRMREATQAAGAASLPQAAIVPDSLAPERIRVALHSSIGAELMRFAFAEEGPYLTAINGKARPGPEAPTVAEHWGAPEGAVLLDFQRSSAGQVFEFDMEEHLLRPEELVGADPFQRPPELAPDIMFGSDRAVLRGTVVVDLEAGTVTIGGDASPAAAAPGEGGPPVEAEPLEPDSSRVEEAAVVLDTVGPADTTTARPDTVVSRPDTAGVGER